MYGPAPDGGTVDNAESVLLSSVPTAAMLFRAHQCVAVNPAYTALMGYEPSEVVGSSVDALIRMVSSGDTASALHERNAQYQEGKNYPGETWVRVVDKRGLPKQVRVRWTTRSDRDEFVVYLIDATEESASRVLAEALARAGGELVHCRDERDVLERAADALASLDLDVTTVLIDREAPELAYGPARTRTMPGEIPADVRNALLQNRPSRESLEKLNPAFSQGSAAFFEEPESTVDAVYPEPLRPMFKLALRGMRLVQAPIFVDGKPYGALLVRSENLTPARAATLEMFAGLVSRAIESVRMKRGAEERLEELQRLQSELLAHERLAALGEAAAVMAHEVRNPIAAILNAVVVLRRKAEREPDVQDMIRVIDEEAYRLERVVRDLLDLGRPLAPSIHPADLGKVASDCVAILRDRHRAVEHAVGVVDRGKPTLALVDPDLLQLALMNVLQNAEQATPVGGRISLEVGYAGGSAEIVVIDQGPGVSDEVARRMFEPFFTTRASGTGIGLAVVRRIVEACGGTLVFETGADGGGRFSMSFPRADAGSDAQ